MQTESFEYIERPVTRCGLWEYLQCRLEDDSSLHLQLARAVRPLKSIVPKTLSSLAPCSCFCCRALVQLFVFVLALRCHFCFCCCALIRVQWSCQFLKILFKQWVMKIRYVSVTPYLVKVLPESHDLDRKCYREEQGVTTDSRFISLAQAFLRGIPRRCRRSQSDFRLIPSFCASSVSLIRSWFSSTKCWK